MTIKEYSELEPWEWPEGAAKEFLKTLKDRRANADDREAAAEMAGDIVAINDQLATALLAIVGDAAEAEHLRARAAISLGPVLELGDTMEFDDPDDVPISEQMYHRILESLEHYYNDLSFPKEVRRRILEASVRATQEWHEDAVLKAYATGDRDWVLTAVFAMHYVAGDWEKQVMESLNSQDEEIHFEAVRAAGGREVEAAWPHVVSLVKQAKTPKELKLAAIEAVSEIKPAEAERVLAPLLESRDKDIVEAADEAIAMAKGVMEMEDDEDGEKEEEEDGEGWLN